MDEKNPARPSKSAKVTDEHRQESARLLAIWEARKPQLQGTPLGTQEGLGASFGVSQGSVGHFLHGRSPISLKAALGFAAALKCNVSDFSPRLAALLHEGPGAYREAPGAFDVGFGGVPHTDTTPAATSPDEERTAPVEEAAPPSRLAITSRDALEHLAKTFQAVPERAREPIARELALLVSVPDSPTLVRRIVTALALYDEPRVPRTLATLSAEVEKHDRTMGAILGRHLEEIRDTKQRRALFALLDGLIDRVLHNSGPDVITSIAESTRDLQPRPAPSTLP